MTLLWFDSFSSYHDFADLSVAGLPSPFSTITGGTAVFFENVTGRRTGVYGLGVNRSSYPLYNLDTNYATLYLGIAVKFYSGTLATYAGQSTLVNSRCLIGFGDGDSPQVTLNPITGSSELAAYSGTTLLGTTSGLGLIIGIWKYFEIQVTIDNSAGVVLVKSDGATVLNLTSQDTQYSGNAYANRIKIAGCNDIVAHFNDFYLSTSQFYGDVRVDKLDVSGAGSHTDFTPSAGSNYENVDDDPHPDDDATYNSGSNVADQDSYAAQDLSAKSPVVAGTTIHGVKSQITVKKTDAGSRGVKVLTRSGGADYLGDEVSLSTTYTSPAKIYETNPADSLAWEDVDVNGAEVGVEITT